MKRTVVVLVAIMSLAACGNGSSSTPDPAPVHDDGTGLGFTYGGKPGIDLGGVVVPFDGSGIQPGFGF